MALTAKEFVDGLALGGMEFADDTRPNARIEWRTIVTEDHSAVFTPEQMDDMGYTWDGTEWQRGEGEKCEPEDSLANVEDDSTGGFTELERDVCYPSNTTDAPTSDES